MTTEGTGSAAHVVWHPRSADELHRLEELAQAAVGFDVRRGDAVVLENVSFSSNTPETKPAGLAQATEQIQTLLKVQPGLLRTLLLSLVGVLMVWFVLRPVAGQVVATLKEPLLLSAESITEARTVAITPVLLPEACRRMLTVRLRRLKRRRTQPRSHQGCGRQPAMRS